MLDAAYLARLPSSTRVASSTTRTLPSTSICMPAFTRMHWVISTDWPLGCSSGGLGVLLALQPRLPPGLDLGLNHRPIDIWRRPLHPQAEVEQGQLPGGLRGPIAASHFRNPNVCGRPEEFFFLRKILPADILFIYSQYTLDLSGVDAILSPPHHPVEPPLPARARPGRAGRRDAAGGPWLGNGALRPKKP